MKTYTEQLKDPRWQRKRLEVMQRDNFECTCCGTKTVTLNVHHTYYERGRMVWDYPTESLQTLCEDCHRMTEKSLKQLRLAFADVDPMCIGGFAMDYANTKVENKANALVIFGWLLRDVGRFNKIIDEYSRNKVEISRRIGLIFANQPDTE